MKINCVKSVKRKSRRKTERESMKKKEEQECKKKWKNKKSVIDKKQKITRDNVRIRWKKIED